MGAATPSAVDEHAYNLLVMSSESPALSEVERVDTSFTIAL